MQFVGPAALEAMMEEATSSENSKGELVRHRDQIALRGTLTGTGTIRKRPQPNSGAICIAHTEVLTPEGVIRMRLGVFLDQIVWFIASGI